MAKIILTKVQEEKLRKNERNFLAAEHPEQAPSSPTDIPPTRFAV